MYNSSNFLERWKQHATSLPGWAGAAKKSIPVTQPSSAAAERAFPLLNSTFGDNQDNSLKDYIETSVKLRYKSSKLFDVHICVCVACV